MKEFDEYQKVAKTFLLEKFFKMPQARLAEYCGLGLNEEAGEMAGKVKRSIREDDEELRPERVMEIAYELGDTLWYLAIAADTIGVSLSEIAKMNIEKLTDRKERGVIKGEGDNR